VSAKAARAVPLLLADIIAAAREAVDYTACGQDAFLNDRMRQRAVIQCFEVIGEATKKLPDAFRTAHPDLPWRYMAAFRDKLIHDYFEVDLALVWVTATRELLALLPRLEQLDSQADDTSEP
jgi:uncharacterized protein with HEPN domain